MIFILDPISTNMKFLPRTLERGLRCSICSTCGVVIVSERQSTPLGVRRAVHMSLASMYGRMPPMKPNSGAKLFEPEEWLEFKRKRQSETTPQILHTEKTLPRSKLPGKNSILVDIGSKINIIGEDTDKEFREQAEAQGHEVWYKSIPTLNVGGVGKGHAQCYKKGTYPVAVDFQHQGRRLHQFTANVASGHAASLPAIMGWPACRTKTL